ncbi:hypothetical protein [Nitrosomonas sp. PY1]|uniref:hypothetical protein n=1 Tax=Nitrosomonas sp. PY1 TaxID=1803906 RepID=UPI001FC817C3|nr:hypothetical protein [Nitrosomonas sp. PY1]
MARPKVGALSVLIVSGCAHGFIDFWPFPKAVKYLVLGQSIHTNQQNSIQYFVSNLFDLFKLL